ncbi:hypothetical protein ANCDUO_22566, partial [Ancylostoma duodenale]
SELTSTTTSNGYSSGCIHGRDDFVLPRLWYDSRIRLRLRWNGNVRRIRWAWIPWIYGHGLWYGIWWIRYGIRLWLWIRRLRYDGRMLWKEV